MCDFAGPPGFVEQLAAVAKRCMPCFLQEQFIEDVLC